MLDRNPFRRAVYGTWAKQKIQKYLCQAHLFCYDKNRSSALQQAGYKVATLPASSPPQKKEKRQVERKNGHQTTDPPTDRTLHSVHSVQADTIHNYVVERIHISTFQHGQTAVVPQALAHRSQLPTIPLLLLSSVPDFPFNAGSTSFISRKLSG